MLWLVLNKAGIPCFGYCCILVFACHICVAVKSLGLFWYMPCFDWLSMKQALLVLQKKSDLIVVCALLWMTGVFSQGFLHFTWYYYTLFFMLYYAVLDNNLLLHFFLFCNVQSFYDLADSWFEKRVNKTYGYTN